MCYAPSSARSTARHTFVSTSDMRSNFSFVSLSHVSCVPSFHSGAAASSTSRVASLIALRICLRFFPEIAIVLSKLKQGHNPALVWAAPGCAAFPGAPSRSESASRRSRVRPPSDSPCGQPVRFPAARRSSASACRDQPTSSIPQPTRTAPSTGFRSSVAAIGRLARISAPLRSLYVHRAQAQCLPNIGATVAVRGVWHKISSAKSVH